MYSDCTWKLNMLQVLQKVNPPLKQRSLSSCSNWETRVLVLHLTSEIVVVPLSICFTSSSLFQYVWDLVKYWSLRKQAQACLATALKGLFLQVGLEEQKILLQLKPKEWVTLRGPKWFWNCQRKKYIITLCSFSVEKREGWQFTTCLATTPKIFTHSDI